MENVFVLRLSKKNRHSQHHCPQV